MKDPCIAGSPSFLPIIFHQTNTSKISTQPETSHPTISRLCCHLLCISHSILPLQLQRLLWRLHHPRHPTSSATCDSLHVVCRRLEAPGPRPEGEQILLWRAGKNGANLGDFQRFFVDFELVFFHGRLGLKGKNYGFCGWILSRLLVGWWEELLLLYLVCNALLHFLVLSKSMMAMKSPAHPLLDGGFWWAVWQTHLPSGKLTQLCKITIFNGKIHYKWWFSIVMLNYQRVYRVILTSARFLNTSFLESISRDLKLLSSSPAQPIVRKALATSWLVALDWAHHTALMSTAGWTNPGWF